VAATDDERIAGAAVDLTEALVRLDTVNPGLVPGAAGESAAVGLLATRLAAAGFDCTVLAPPGQPDRPSLLARSGPPATPGGTRRSLLLNGHLDTVGTGLMADPFGARVEGDRRTGRMHGRGTCDMKAGVAAMVVAAEALASAAHSGGQGTVWLALVADEEHASTGTDTVVAHMAERGELPDACLVAEPTWLDLAVAHRGFAVIDVAISGRAAHSSQPQDGVNAVTHLGRLLAAVEEADALLRERPPHPDSGHGSLMVTVASGGESPFLLPASARAVVERRTVPGERSADALTEVEALVRRLREEDPQVEMTCRLTLAREAWEMDGSAGSNHLAELLSAELVAAGSPAPQRFGAPYWMESALWQEADRRLRPGRRRPARGRRVGGPRPGARVRRRARAGGRDVPARLRRAGCDVLGSRDDRTARCPDRGVRRRPRGRHRRGDPRR
jgi:acetylornithine deacetylase